MPDGTHWSYLSHVTDICVGYRLGEYRQGTVAVLEPGQVPTTSEKMKAIASNFQCYVGTSGYAPVDPVSQTGHWMWILVRTTSTGDVMVMPTFVSEGLSEVSTKHTIYCWSAKGLDFKCCLSLGRQVMS